MVHEKRPRGTLVCDTRPATGERTPTRCQRPDLQGSSTIVHSRLPSFAEQPTKNRQVVAGLSGTLTPHRLRQPGRQQHPQLLRPRLLVGSRPACHLPVSSPTSPRPPGQVMVDATCKATLTLDTSLTTCQRAPPKSVLLTTPVVDRETERLHDRP